MGALLCVCMPDVARIHASASSTGAIPGPVVWHCGLRRSAWKSTRRESRTVRSCRAGHRRPFCRCRRGRARCEDAGEQGVKTRTSKLGSSVSVSAHLCSVLSVTRAAYCGVLQANGGLVCEESPVFLVLRFSWKLDGLTDEDKCDTV